jgi:hypothetical protein
VLLGQHLGAAGCAQDRDPEAKLDDALAGLGLELEDNLEEESLGQEWGWELELESEQQSELELGLGDELESEVKTELRGKGQGQELDRDDNELELGLELEAGPISRVNRADISAQLCLLDGLAQDWEDPRSATSLLFTVIPLFCLCQEVDDCCRRLPYDFGCTLRNSAINPNIM